MRWIHFYNKETKATPFQPDHSIYKVPQIQVKPKPRINSNLMLYWILRILFYNNIHCKNKIRDSVPKHLWIKCRQEIYFSHSRWWQVLRHPNYILTNKQDRIIFSQWIRTCSFSPCWINLIRSCRNNSLINLSTIKCDHFNNSISYSSFKEVLHRDNSTLINRCRTKGNSSEGKYPVPWDNRINLLSTSSHGKRNTDLEL